MTSQGEFFYRFDRSNNLNQLFITIIFKILSGGPLTITDANLCLGRLLPEYFPKIFGKNQKSPLDKAATDKAFKKLTREVRMLQC